MQYIQILLITAGVIYCVSHFSSNHINRTKGTGHYSWIHPRFLTLAITIVSCLLLLLWPIALGFQRHPVIGSLIILGLVGATALALKIFEWWRVLVIAPFSIPLMGLLIGGMPLELSKSATITILNLVPTVYILHHNDEGLSKLLHRDDIRIALIVWFAGHLGAYWSLATVVWTISWSVAPSVFWSGKPIALTSLTILVLVLFSKRLYSRRASVRVRMQKPASDDKRQAKAEHGSHIIEML